MLKIDFVRYLLKYFIHFIILFLSADPFWRSSVLESFGFPTIGRSLMASKLPGNTLGSRGCPGGPGDVPGGVPGCQQVPAAPHGAVPASLGPILMHVLAMKQHIYIQNMI